MGKLIKTGASIECDRNGRFETVTDEKAIAFYEKFLSEKKPGECMFAAVLITHEGERRVQFETLGPAGIKAVSGYLDKIAPAKKAKTPKPATDQSAPAPAPAPDPDKKTESDKKGEEASVEPDRDAGASKEGATATETPAVSEDEMWVEDD